MTDQEVSAVEYGITAALAAAIAAATVACAAVAAWIHTARALRLERALRRVTTAALERDLDAASRRLAAVPAQPAQQAPDAVFEPARKGD